mgnify:CR=1 FL=1|jgi:7-cyano-7-deazaguanine reductase|tara:strand:- start:921 stop:1706 length:786 start_codon:yes stop_codon:yes gene_type:complete
MKLEAITELGQETNYSKRYSPEILIAIARKNMPVACFGYDTWRAYELSWLGAHNVPQVATIVISYKASSNFIVESKSLKLYLGSFNFIQFSDSGMILRTIARDLSFKLSTHVNVYFDHEMIRSKPQGQCIDELQADLIVAAEPDKNELQTSPELVTDYNLYSNLFRSCCPVTNQPDWASILITYSGNKINEDTLLAYLVSYRNHQSFHEECVSKIYADIFTRCKPDSLTVKGYFTRRGGIDINPMRSSEENHTENYYLARQ